jgi:hypothetical protein
MVFQYAKLWKIVLHVRKATEVTKGVLCKTELVSGIVNYTPNRVAICSGYT